MPIFPLNIRLMKPHMKKMRRSLLFLVSCMAFGNVRSQSYPQQYFRHPLDIPMQLVANFGEIRPNHWHMGLDIRTQHRVNLPVHAAADGYIGRVLVEPGGFGQAIYIRHPNGYTTLYGHLNSFFPALAQYVKSQQYQRQSWNVDLMIPEGLFPVKKGDVIALSGSTGASEGPHVHFEIRDSRTDKCLNPLLFHFPLADEVPPTIYRLAFYDRHMSTYRQQPRFVSLKNTGGHYVLAAPGVLGVGSDRISFALGAYDRFSGTANHCGIYCAEMAVDGKPVSQFLLDNIGYEETRYINAQVDYPYRAGGGATLQHLSPLPGAGSVAYNLFHSDGLVHLEDGQVHAILIEVEDANRNRTTLQFSVQYDEKLSKPDPAPANQVFLPGNLNVFEQGDFELYTTEASLYDTVEVRYQSGPSTGQGSVSPVHRFLDASIPVQDSVTVRIKPLRELSPEERDRVLIQNVSGSRTYVQKAQWQKGWLTARFRQFGTYQAFLDTEPPQVSLPSSNLSGLSRLVFTPRDNFNSIRFFRLELDGQWLNCSNDKGKTWIYNFDEHFPPGEHELKITVEDEAGNTITRTCRVRR
ncbi:MAG: M23 family metallopeptidase [Flavisolibacter sp.]